ncbi:hypothetical protein SNE40_007786 [Patella caerulea]|uniref:RING-type E3 ubiquitin transferase n=1 Tax=Patella caerulea TaxID=87958 RepID=A0AAN8K0I7_PATCE
MGNSSSGHSGRGTGGGDLSSLRSDWPLHFHNVHGENVRLSADKTRATRVESFCKGICFSNRPIAVNEKVYINFAEVSTSWSGVLRFGFTGTNPDTYNPAELPRYACPDLTNKPGTFAKALSERFAKTNTVMCFFVTRSGDVMFSVNGEDKGLFFNGVNTNGPLWALLDIYGNTMSVEFLHRPEAAPVLNNMVGTASTVESAELFQSIQSLSIDDSSPAIRYHANVDLVPMTFHNMCGKNLYLNRDMTIATRTVDEYCNAYAFTSRPLHCGEKIVIQILNIEQLYVGGIAFGLTVCDPATLTGDDLPDDSDWLLDRKEYWVVNKDICRKPDVGDELSFYLTSEGEVRYSRNNHKVATLMHVDRNLPLWAFFDVYGNVQKIRLLGSTVPGAQSRLPRSRSASSYSSLTVALPPRPPPPASLAQSTATIPSSGISYPMLPLQPQVLRSFSVPAATTQQQSASPINNYQSQLSVASPSLSQPLTPSLPSSSIPSTPDTSMDTLFSDDSIQQECSVCCERPVNCVLYTCGHMCMCYDCAIVVKREKGGLCPICRQTIKDVIKTYRS